ncbi:MAG: metal-dependent hydrolase [Chitinophagaceae bacterium]
MDSVSHIILGAAIGEITLGKKIGRWGMLIGAFAKTFPDFDLLYTGLKDAKMYMCHHRGHTHSLIWESLYAIPLAFLTYLIFRKKVSFKAVLFAWLACLWGHSILDTFTNYGTRLLLPFTNESYAINTISIVDLVFTVPMLLACIISLFFSNKKNLRFRFNKGILVYAMSYLFLILINKGFMNQLFKKSLEQEKIPYSAYMTNPSILNNVLWYANAVNDSVLYTAEYSLFDNTKKLHWVAYPRHTEWAAQYSNQEDIKALKWFSRGYDICAQKGDTLNYYCVKFGKNSFIDTSLEKSFVFHYVLYKKPDGYFFGFKEPPRDKSNFKKGIEELWTRIKGQ